MWSKGLVSGTFGLLIIGLAGWARSQTVDDTGSRVRLEQAMREEARKLLGPGVLSRGEPFRGAVSSQDLSWKEVKLRLQLLPLQAERAVLAMKIWKSEIDKLELQGISAGMELTRARLQNKQVKKELRLLEYQKRNRLLIHPEPAAAPLQP